VPEAQWQSGALHTAGSHEYAAMKWEKEVQRNEVRINKKGLVEKQNADNRTRMFGDY
jgi:hypothetical protein